MPWSVGDPKRQLPEAKKNARVLACALRCGRHAVKEPVSFPALSIPRGPSQTLLAWLAGMPFALMAAILSWQLVHRPRELDTPGTFLRGAAAPPALQQLPGRPGALVKHELLPLSVGDAGQRNAAVPFADLHPIAALPFQFSGTAVDLARATDCLALAAMAEDISSEEGERAVMQVVLNRVRHPAFAKTVCGAVFQGSERATGCQFTFTCDGSLGKNYRDDSWALARRRAQEALGGLVFAPVGLATHYHTNAVYPYWSSELEKIAGVGSHLFFRWPGYWGSRAAMIAHYRGNEPAIPSLSNLASHAPQIEQTSSIGLDGAANALPPTETSAGEVVVSDPARSAFFVYANPKASADATLSLARQLCGTLNKYCETMAWIDRSSIPEHYPLPRAGRETLTFSYVLQAGRETVFYDCKHFSGVPRDRCMPAAPAVKTEPLCSIPRNSEAAQTAAAMLAAKPPAGPGAPPIIQDRPFNIVAGSIACSSFRLPPAKPANEHTAARSN